MTISLILVLSVFGLLIALYYARQVSQIPLTQGISDSAEAERLRKIHGAISKGAMAFLTQEYRYMIYFMVAFAVLISFLVDDPHTANLNEGMYTALSFLLGAGVSMVSGFIGMKIATIGNARTTVSAKTSISKAFQVALQSGAVMGFGLVGLAVFGLIGVYLMLVGLLPSGVDTHILMEVMAGFGLGGSSIALFGRVGGGIFTKAADVGADLVGKVEQGIPEDDPRSPAVIADNVGDNVGDVAGMGADLFESYVGSIIGTMVLGAAFMTSAQVAGGAWTDEFGGLSGVLLPLALAGTGILTSIFGTFFVKVKEGGNPQKALNMGELISSILMLVATWFIVKGMLPESWSMGENLNYGSTGVFVAVILGLFAGLGIGYITEFYTGTGTSPVKSIAKQSLTGSATNIIAGLGVGMQSTAIPIIILCIAIVGAYHFAGLYGIAIAAVGMLSNTGIQLAVDAYGPISDNAGGIAEMSELPKEVRQRTDKLDAVGNTTAAIGKGFAIGSAALTALALFAAFMETAKINSIDVSKPLVTAGLFLGGMLPFLFSSLAMGAVGRAAMDMIQEVRRQFANIPALKAALDVMKKNAGKEFKDWSKADQETFEAASGKAEYSKCVEISTKASIREMLLPGRGRCHADEAPPPRRCAAVLVRYESCVQMYGPRGCKVAVPRPRFGPKCAGKCRPTI